MPTPRLPTSIHEARGNFEKNPKRGKARENEAVNPDPIGGYPAIFKPVGDFDSNKKQRLRGIWDEIIADAAPGVLNRAHRFHLEATCCLMYIVRHETASTGDRTNLRNHLRDLGMTPASQSTVERGTFTPPGESSAFSSLSRKAQQRAG